MAADDKAASNDAIAAKTPAAGAPWESPDGWGTQVTHGPGGRILTNINVWSPDSRFIVYDTRSDADGTVFDGREINIVDVATGAVQTVYTSRNGACCGVATFHPTERRVVFILGPEHPTPDWQYGPAHRQGVIVDLARPGAAVNLDARDLAPPFTPGALRGGSHVHVYSPDGRSVSFTYNDAILSRFTDTDTDARHADTAHDIDQRNIGVSAVFALTPCPSPNSGRGESGGVSGCGCAPGTVVSRPLPRTRLCALQMPDGLPDSPLPYLGEGQGVRAKPSRNHSGIAFSVLVTRTTANPVPGSDEIQRAFEEGWIGRRGYRRADGTWQTHALAFLGEVIASDGPPLVEVFVADLPDDLTVPGPDGPLEGTETRRPAPPRGTVQRRVTFTADRRYPGIQGPRHWVRSSPDGSRIAFLMRDDGGTVQIWTVSPNGGTPVPVTRDAWSVASAFSWSPDGREIAYVADNSVFAAAVETGRSRRLTPRSADAPLPLACVFSPDGTRIACLRRVPDSSVPGAMRHNQIYVVPATRSVEIVGGAFDPAATEQGENGPERDEDQGKQTPDGVSQD